MSDVAVEVFEHHTAQSEYDKHCGDQEHEFWRNGRLPDSGRSTLTGSGERLSECRSALLLSQFVGRTRIWCGAQEGASTVILLDSSY